MSEQEQWENVIEQEIQFYLNFKQYEEEIHDRLKEVEEWIEYPVTIFDSDMGMVYRTCAGTEEQAIRRIVKRDSLNALLERAHKRINRLFNAYSQLDEESKDLISYLYFEPDYSDADLVRVFGFSSKKALYQQKTNVLKKMFRIYQKERSEAAEEFKRLLKEERKEKARLLIKQYYKGAV